MSRLWATTHEARAAWIWILLAVFVAFTLVLLLPPAGALSAPIGGPGNAAEGLLVRVKADTTPASLDALAAGLGASMYEEVRAEALLPEGQRIILFYVARPLELERVAQEDPSVIATSPNYVRQVTVPVYPDDPRFSDLWGMENTGQSGGTPGADISAPFGWSVTTGGSDVVIADIDTGVDYGHEDLAANMWQNPNEIPANSIDDDGNGYVDDIYGMDAVNGDVDPMDDHGHGSHTSGTAAGVGDNAIGVTGVAWTARIMALKAFDAAGSGTDADCIECIDYAVDEKVNHGQNVVAINASWGGSPFNQLLKDAIDAAGTAGIVFCAAAGNRTNDNDVTPHYPSSYTSANIISVAATDHNDDLALFPTWGSNWGATSVDLGAPGASIWSTLPGDTYGSWSGTSMATPHVSGAVALLAEQFPGDTVAQRIQRILTTVDPLSTLAGLCTTGGRLNLGAALGAPFTYLITPSVVGGHGAIVPSTPQEVDVGATPTFTFRPDTGYKVKEVRVDGALVTMTGINRYTFPPVTTNHEITVEFELQMYPVTALAATGGGAVSPAGTTWVPYGGSLTVRVTPAAHYKVDRVTVDGFRVSLSGGAFTFRNMWSGHLLEAFFALESYVVAPSVVNLSDGRPHGTITPNTARTYTWGTTPRFTFTPDPGYAVAEVRVDGVQMLPTPRTSYTFAALTGPHTITVRFMKAYVPAPQ